MKQVKYEYDIVDAQYGYVIERVYVREDARKLKQEFSVECPKQKINIIQRKYKLAEEKVVR